MSGQPGHLKADLDQVSSAGQRIDDIKQQFTETSKPPTGYRADIGSDELASALDAFGSDWELHRHALIAKLDRVAALCATAVKSYTTTDEQLAAALSKAEKQQDAKAENDTKSGNVPDPDWQNPVSPWTPLVPRVR